MAAESNLVPFEATTEFLTQQVIERDAPIREFMASLTPDERNRFLEFAHHLVHEGFAQGRKPVSDPSIELQAASGTRLLAVYLQGAGEGTQTVDKYYGDGKQEL